MLRLSTEPLQLQYNLCLQLRRRACSGASVPAPVPAPVPVPARDGLHQLPSYNRSLLAAMMHLRHQHFSTNWLAQLQGTQMSNIPAPHVNAVPLWLFLLLQVPIEEEPAAEKPAEAEEGAPAEAAAEEGKAEEEAAETEGEKKAEEVKEGDEVEVEGG